MSLFNAPKNSVLVHGCNGRGIWGAGIAKSFKEKYPNAFKEYGAYCAHKLNTDPLNGASATALLTAEDNGHRIGCLISSLDYGDKKDSPDKIALNTILALKDLLSYLNTYQLKTDPIYSNKFNSGLFKVPWHTTERILKFFVERYDINWIVCDPEL